MTPPCGDDRSILAAGEDAAEAEADLDDALDAHDRAMFRQLARLVADELTRELFKPGMGPMLIPDHVAAVLASVPPYHMQFQVLPGTYHDVRVHTQNGPGGILSLWLEFDGQYRVWEGVLRPANLAGPPGRRRTNMNEGTGWPAPSAAYGEPEPADFDPRSAPPGWNDPGPLPAREAAAAALPPTAIFGVPSSAIGHPPVDVVDPPAGWTTEEIARAWITHLRGAVGVFRGVLAVLPHGDVEKVLSEAGALAEQLARIGL